MGEIVGGDDSVPIVLEPEVLCFLAPFIITASAYILGRKLFFPKYKQSEMHTIKSGRIFTGSICILHLGLMIVLFFKFVY